MQSRKDMEHLGGIGEGVVLSRLLLLDSIRVEFCEMDWKGNQKALEAFLRSLVFILETKGKH